MQASFAFGWVATSTFCSTFISSGVGGGSGGGMAAQNHLDELRDEGVSNSSSSNDSYSRVTNPSRCITSFAFGWVATSTFCSTFISSGGLGFASATMIAGLG